MKMGIKVPFKWKTNNIHSELNITKSENFAVHKGFITIKDRYYCLQIKIIYSELNKTKGQMSMNSLWFIKVPIRKEKM